MRYRTGRRAALAVAGLILVLVLGAMSVMAMDVRALLLPAPTGAYRVCRTVLPLTLAAPQQPDDPVPTVTLFAPEAASASDPPGRLWPVLFYFPGWDGSAIENWALVQDLASHGFAVVALHYPGAHPPPMDFSSTAAFDATVREADRRVRQRARDAVRVLDALSRPGAPDTERMRRLDLSRVGGVGYSLGGAVAGQTCWLDPRFRAAGNLDGWQFAEAAEDGFAQPALIFSDDGLDVTEADLNAAEPARRYPARLNRAELDRIDRNLSRHAGIFLVIAGTTHQSFADLGGRSTLRALLSSLAGDPHRIDRLVSTYVRDFFRTTLDGASPDLLRTGAIADPAVRMRILGAWPPQK